MENTTEPTPQETMPTTPAIDQEKLSIFLEKLKLEQNFPVALLAGVAVAVIGAVLWAVISVATGYQIGYMAVAIGLMVGFTVKFTGKGMDQIFGITGAALALFSCLLGNFFSILGFIAQSEGLGYVEILGLFDYSLVPDLMMETFSPMDLLFYAIAGYEGYKFAFRTVTEEEIAANAAK